MMSNYNAKVEISADKRTEAIFRAIEIDDRFYEENPTKINFSFDEKITIMIEGEEIPHLRANLNSILRLVQVSNDSIESVKI